MAGVCHATVVFFSSRPTRLGEKVVFSAIKEALAPSNIALVWPLTLDWFSRNVVPQTSRCLIGVCPSVEDVRHAHGLLGRLLAAGVPRAHIWFVLCDFNSPGKLSSEIIQKELGPLSGILSMDISLLFETKVHPRSPLFRAFNKLALDIQTWCAELPKDQNEEVDWRVIEERVAARLWGGSEVSSRDRTSDIDRALHSALLEAKVEICPPALFSALRQRIHDHVTGLGPIESLLRDPELNEIMINGTNPIFIEKNGRMQQTSAMFESENQLRTVIDRVVGRMGRRVDVSSPFCDVRLPDGSRVNVVLPPLSLAGPVMTIRRFKTLYQSLEDLISAGTIDEEQSFVLRKAVQERKNILVAGNTGAGKTTLLNVLAGLIPPEERIITLEDAAELQIRQPHVIRLETRPKNAEGHGQVSMSDLVVNALRMRPDRLVIGECRGAEVIPMIQAMNTGHDGSMSTLHANSAGDAMKRLESLMLLHAPEWSLEVVRQQIVAGIQMIVFLKRQGPERKLVEIVHV